MTKTRAGQFSHFLVLILLWSIILQGFAGFTTPVEAVEMDPYGFEQDIDLWETNDVAGFSVDGAQAILSAGSDDSGNTYDNTWTVFPNGSSMGILKPAESGTDYPTFETMAETLGLSAFSADYIASQFPDDSGAAANTTTITYLYTNRYFMADETFTMAWNYIANDYDPYNDGSFGFMVDPDDSSAVPKVDSYDAQISILGTTVAGTGNYSTGDYGCTGWQTITFQATEAGIYRIGFVVFNLRDPLQSPTLIVDQQPGVTLKNDAPFDPIARDPDAPPPPVQTAPSVLTNGAYQITTTAAVLNGTVTYDGLATVTEHGFVLSTTVNPTVDDQKVTAGSGTGAYNASIAGLAPGTTYYFRAYAINEIGVGYGATFLFSTVPAAPVAIDATNITSHSFSSRWNEVAGATSYWLDVATDSGFMQMVSGYSSLGVASVLTHTVSGLSPATTYYYRVRATTEGGTSQSSNVVVVTTAKTAQSITFPALTDAVYGDADIAPGATASSGLALTYESSNPAVATVVDGKIRITGVGTTVITSTQTGDEAWDVAASQQQTLTVTPRPITVTADAASKIYGEADPALTWRLLDGELVGEDAITGDLSRTAGEDVGSYAIGQGSLSAGGNYAITFVTENLAIQQRPITVRAHAKTREYGDPDPELTWSIKTGTLADGDEMTGALARDVGEIVGSYEIGQGSLTAGDNYAITYESATLTIAKRQVTIELHAASKIYGDPDPAFSWSFVSGTILAGDPFLCGITRLPGENVGLHTLAAAPLIYDYANYAVTVQHRKLTITKRAITVTADAEGKTYGDVDPELGWTVTTGSLAMGDALVGTLSRATGENVGSYDIGQGTLDAGDNYTLSFVTGTFTVSQRPLTIAAYAQEKTYGEADPDWTWWMPHGSMVGMDPVTGELSRAAGDDVGDYHIGQGTLDAGDNYAITFTPANLEIRPRPITIAAEATNKVYGETDPDLTWELTAGTLVGDDAITGDLGRAIGENVGSYAIEQGSLTAGDNYAITLVPANLLITSRPLSIYINSQEKTYGDPDPELTWTVATGSLAMGDTLAGTLSRAEGENVGNHAIGQGTLSGGDGYTITFIPGELAISQRPITITADEQSKTYGDADPALTWKLTAGTLAGDDAITGDLSRTAGENIGTYPIGQGTLTGGSNYAVTFETANFAITPYLENLERGEVQNGAAADNDGTLQYSATARAGFGFAYWSDGTTLFSTFPELVDPAGGIGAYTPVIWPVSPTTDMQVITLAPEAPTTVTFLNGAVRMTLPSHTESAAVLSITPLDVFDDTDALPEGLAPASRFFAMLRSENLTGVPIRIEIDLDQLDADLNDDETASLVLYHWDETTGAWERTSIASQGIDEEAGILWAELDHFSTYGLFYEADIVDTGDTTNTSLAGLAVLGSSLIAGSLALLRRKRRMDATEGSVTND